MSQSKLAAGSREPAADTSYHVLDNVIQASLPFAQPVGNGIAVPPPVLEPRIEFVRMPRARRYILRVRPDGTLRVTVPRGGSRREAQEFVERQRRWIERERIRVRQEHAPSEWRDGSVILFRGAPVRLFVQPRGDGWIVRYAEREVHASLAGDVRAAVERDLRSLARVELVARLHELAVRHDLRPAAVTIRNQRSRWGSCGRTGTIALNFRLVQMPADVRDYVLVHELMHMRHQNHSRRFWKLVAAACPNYREAERWLRVQGKALF